MDNSYQAMRRFPWRNVVFVVFAFHAFLTFADNEPAWWRERGVIATRAERRVVDGAVNHVAVCVADSVLDYIGNSTRALPPPPHTHTYIHTHTRSKCADRTRPSHT